MGTVGVAESVVLAVLSLPLLLRWVPPNRLYGMRTRLTLTNPDIWYPANQFAGGALFIAASVSVVVFSLSPQAWLARPWISSGIFLVPLAVAIAASYFHLRRF
jgi:hypothetical protein